MKSQLGEFKVRFLHSISAEDDLVISEIDEGFRAKQAESIDVGGVMIEGVYRLETRSDGRRIRLTFKMPVAWQVVSESFCSGDAYEKAEGKDGLVEYSQSRYLDYVNLRHGLYKDLRGACKHYQVGTGDSIIDIVSSVPPVFEMVLK